jgi:hypothetical protein
MSFQHPAGSTQLLRPKKADFSGFFARGFLGTGLLRYRSKGLRKICNFSREKAVSCLL